ncbi:hypothetical protein JOC86_003058 [Bacillus pakistanensis]|uniref:Hydrolase n=1 Tax=Rossellomorea pakistanensis TaxID=992288 RepID=A0ABS2NF82_9BACI|nr:hydrolase [Bacillus pakistanensis]MBM7586506.1 hypothetical protein [Bacillus pakistanensis]
MKHRSFQLEQQWCMIHYPERPNGFGVMILGDYHHYVDNNSSFWLQQEARSPIIRALNDNGYFVFYSNLFGANWGSDRAVQLAKRMYQYVKRTEIMNSKIHILADGMGALVLRKLYPMLRNDLRSVVLYSPCVSLYEHYHQEKEQKFFFKKLQKEISQANEINEKDCEQWINFYQGDYLDFMSYSIPLYMIQWVSTSRYKKQFPFIKEIYKDRMKKEYLTDLFFLLPEKKSTIGGKITSYFQKHEYEL